MRKGIKQCQAHDLSLQILESICHGQKNYGFFLEIIGSKLGIFNPAVVILGSQAVDRQKSKGLGEAEMTGGNLNLH
jgi:hypothetical protein